MDKNRETQIAHALGTIFILQSLVFPAPRKAAAEIRLASLFGDNAVLQQGRIVPVWGWANPGETVTVSMGAKKVSTTAGDTGCWRVDLGPMEPGGPYEMVIAGRTEIRLENILVGEVWVCAGQSNMERSVSLEWDGDREVVTTEYPNIRLFQVPHAFSGEPQRDTTASWKIAVPATVGDFSAAGFYFGRFLRKELEVPVGLIQTTYDGSSMCAWCPRSTIEEIWKPEYIEQAENRLRESARAVREYSEKLAVWVEEADAAEREGKVVPFPPDKPRDRRLDQSHPCRLFNGMVAPLIPYAVAGVIWHQGEADANRKVRYKRLFPALIRGWRRQWGQGDFPFLFVQLNNYIPPESRADEPRWAEFREEQAAALQEPNTGMVVTIDIGDPHDIHPKNKKEVARRLAVLALAKVYGRDVPYSGPVYRSMSIEGNKIRITFDHTTGGLGVKGERRVLGFTIAGPDRVFKPARVRIDGDSVVVSSPEVPQPVAVRYAWADNPKANLFNKAGFPAAPFRTDDWPGVVREMR